MPQQIIQAQPPLEFLAPQVNPLVVNITHAALPILTSWLTNIEQIEAHNVETLVNLYQQFQQGKIRLLLAFRHPSIQDPYCLGNLVGNIIPQTAKKQGITLEKPVHAHFMYDRGIPLWAGNLVTWFFPRLGGIPIHRGKFDRLGLKTARDIFANGKFPLVAAPEGATNGHNELVSPLEPGIAQMGFWCVEDLLKAGRDEEVVIVPVGLQYSYLTSPWDAIAQLLAQLETDVGIVPFSQATDPNTLYQRLYQLGEHLLGLMEDFYQRFYHHSFTSNNESITAPNSDPNQIFAQRLQTLLNTALQVAEQYFDLTPKGTVIDRCRRLEQAAWDCIYREDLKNEEAISPVARGLADKIAAEANLRIWHMRLVESFVAVTGKYVKEKLTGDRFADTLLLTWDTITKIKSQDLSKRPSLGKKKAKITIGDPISVTQRWEFYQGNRRQGKQAVSDLTQDLQTALEKMIEL